MDPENDQKPLDQTTPPVRDEEPDRVMGMLLIAIGIVGSMVVVLYFFSVLMEPAS